MAFVFLILVFFIDHYCAAIGGSDGGGGGVCVWEGRGVFDKHCLLSFFHLITSLMLSFYELKRSTIKC